MNTVAICDTEPVAIEGLRSLLQSVEGLRVSAAETSLEDAMNAVRDLRPRLVVLDRAFGLREILDFLRALRHTGTETGAVVWGAAITKSEALRLLQAGASGVVRKTSSLDSLRACIVQVAAGATWMEDAVFGGREPAFGPAGRLPLTSREQQVLDLVERGMRNREIAENLGIRVGTVKIHLKHIFEKKGIRGRYGLAISGLKDKGLLTTMPV